MGWFFVQEQGLPHDLRRRLRSFFLSPGWSIYDFLGKNYGKILWKTTLRKLQDEYTVHGCDRSNHPPVVRLPLWIDGLKARVLLELNQALSQFFFSGLVTLAGVGWIQQHLRQNRYQSQYAPWSLISCRRRSLGSELNYWSVHTRGKSFFPPPDIVIFLICVFFENRVPQFKLPLLIISSWVPLYPYKN